jgi:hypothetical protein
MWITSDVAFVGPAAPCRSAALPGLSNRAARVTQLARQLALESFLYLFINSLAIFYNLIPFLTSQSFFTQSRPLDLDQMDMLNWGHVLDKENSG